MDGAPTERIDWLRAVIHQCSDKAHRIAAAIEMRYNRQIGYAYPSHAQLAADTGTSQDTVIRAVRELVAKGFLAVKKPDIQGRGTANQYRPIWEAGSPRTAATLPEHKGGQTCDPFDRGRGGRPATLSGPEGGADLRSEGSQIVHQKGGPNCDPNPVIHNPVNEPGSNAGACEPAKSDADLWRFEIGTTPTSQALKRAGAKIGPANWRAWHALVETHGIDRVVAAAQSVPADRRWPDATEMALVGRRGQEPIGQAVAHKIRPIALS